MRKSFLFFSLFILSMLLSAGCVNLSTKYLAQQQYGLSVKQPSPVPHKTDKILEIYYPNIAAQFSGSNFVYKANESEYTNDFYNKFFTSPVDDIDQSVIKYLQNSRLFKYASDDITPLRPDYILKTNVTELYADYRDKNAPRAVMSVQFTLVNTEDKPQIIMNKTFRQSILLRDKSSISLIVGWNKCLQNILSRLLVTLEQKNL